MLYWRVGKRINYEVLKGKRAVYSKEVIKELAIELTEQYGKGWGERQLRHLVRFAEFYTDDLIVYTPCKQLKCTLKKNPILKNIPLPLRPNCELHFLKCTIS